MTGREKSGGGGCVYVEGEKVCNLMGCSWRLLCTVGTWVTSEQRLAGREGAGSVGTWKKGVFWVQGNSLCKGPGASPTWQLEAHVAGAE